MKQGIEAGDFLEWAEVHGNFYGTSKAAVAAVAATGKCCVLDIDVQGARSVRAAGLPCTFVFVMPPSLAELEARLRGRGTEGEESIRKRLGNAEGEMAAAAEPGLFDFVVTNRDLDVAYRELEEVALAAARGAPAQRYALVGSRPRPPSAVEAGMGKWADRVAVVTGASAGIGREVALTLLRHGMRVVACARRKEKLEELKGSIAREPGGGGLLAGFLPLQLDVTKEAEVLVLAKVVAGRWPGAGIDVLVNNAGLARADAGLLDGATRSWVEMLNTNVLALCILSREAVRSMAARGVPGHIVNVGSLSGHRVRPGHGLGFYAATKHAVKALTEALRMEVAAAGLPVRVSAVSPGVVATDFYDTLHYGDRAAGADRYAALDYEALTPRDIAQAVLFQLCMPANALVQDVLLRPAGQQE